MMGQQAILFLLVSSVSFGYSGYKLFTLFKIMKNHQGKVPPFGNMAKRIFLSFIDIFGQRAILQKKVAGIMHAIIFWGFLIISIGTLEQFVSTLAPSISFEFIGKIPYSILLFIQDGLTACVLLAVAYAFYRRLVLRPKSLGQSKDANRILFLTGSLMISIFLMNGYHLLSHPLWYHQAMPFSKGVSHLLKHLSLDFLSLNASLWIFFKWVHMLLVLGFSMYIPSSKHLHIIAAGPNTFLKTLPREKAMTPISFDDQNVTRYGAEKITDLGWKDALDYYSCTECGRCQDLCPAYTTEKPLTPKMLILDLKQNMFQNKDKILAQNYDSVSSILDEHVTEDVIWSCTSCRACEIACPVFIAHTDKIYEIRRHLVMNQSQFPPEVQPVFKNLETESTPWAFSSQSRADWAEGLDVAVMAQSPEIEILLWVGCAGSYDDRNKKVLRALTSLLKKAGVKFAILGTEEKCTGDPARRIGNEYLYQSLAKENIETLNRYQIKKILTACPHCFNTIKNEYKDFGGNYEVMHHSQFIAELLSQGKIKPTQSYQETTTFHDSCYLGRWNGIYDDPRKIIESTTSMQVVEMKNNHDQSLCCGAGGGRMFMEEKLGTRINLARTEQVLETKASVVASSCPFCLTMLTDGIKSKAMQNQIKALDIAELLDQNTPTPSLSNQ